MINESVLFKGKNLLIPLSLSGIVSSCLIYSHAFLDYALLPKLFALSLTLLFSSLLLSYKYYKTSKSKRFIVANKSLVPLMLFILFATISILWATNKQLALLDISKKILFLVLLIIANAFLAENNIDKFKFIILPIFGVSIIANWLAISEGLSLEGISHSELGGVKSISGNKNLISSFDFLCLIFSIIGVSTQKGWKRSISILLSFIQIGLIIFIQSRGVLIALLVFTFILGLFNFVLKRTKPLVKYNNNRSNIYLLVVAVIVNLVFLVALPRIIKRTSQKDYTHNSSSWVFNSSTARERVLIWEKTYELFKQNPWIGVGSNNWQIMAPKNGLPNIKRVKSSNANFQRPHNDFLWVLSEYGIIGFNLLLLFVLLFLRHILIKVLYEHSRQGAIIFAGIVGFLAISFFSYPIERIEHNILLALIIAYALPSRDTKKTSIYINTKMFLSFAFIVSFLIVMLTFSLLSSDYYMKKIIVNGNNSSDDVIAYCERINTSYYSCNAFTIPVDWYKGNALVLKKKYSEAFIALSKAAHYHPYNASVLSDLGSAYYMKGNKDQAIVLYKRALSINPEQKNTLYNLLNVLIEEERYSEAAKHVKFVKDEVYLQDYIELIKLKFKN